jgi:hypothetical protein
MSGQIAKGLVRSYAGTFILSPQPPMTDWTDLLHTPLHRNVVARSHRCCTREMHQVTKLPHMRLNRYPPRLEMHPRRRACRDAQCRRRPRRRFPPRHSLAAQKVSQALQWLNAGRTLGTHLAHAGP